MKKTFVNQNECKVDNKNPHVKRIGKLTGKTDKRRLPHNPPIFWF